MVGLMRVDKGAVWRALVDALDALEGYTRDYQKLLLHAMRNRVMRAAPPDLAFAPGA